jgi:rhodanese-related sulfurtransferase
MDTYIRSKNAYILDIRTPLEYAGGHIGGAINIDVLSADFNTGIDTLNKEKNYFLYCKAGKSSEEALNKMKEAGFKNLRHLKGGIEAWKEQGNEFEKK